jgi:hypothetical protein
VAGDPIGGIFAAVSTPEGTDGGGMETVASGCVIVVTIG